MLSFRIQYIAKRKNNSGENITLLMKKKKNVIVQSFQGDEINFFVISSNISLSSRTYSCLKINIFFILYIYMKPNLFKLI